MSTQKSNLIMALLMLLPLSAAAQTEAWIIRERPSGIIVPEYYEEVDAYGGHRYGYREREAREYVVEPRFPGSGMADDLQRELDAWELPP